MATSERSRIEIYCAAAARPLPAGAERASLESALASVEERARAGLGTIVWSRERFFTHLGQRAGQATLASLGSLRAADLWLACACAHGEPAALERLDRELSRLVSARVARFNRSPDFADEVRQELRVVLLLGRDGAHGRIADYAGQGELARWLGVAAMRAAISLQRTEKPAGPESLLDALMPGPDPELDFIKLRDREAVRNALLDSVRELDKRDVGLLRLHHIEGVPLDKLASSHQVHRATMARWLASARAGVLERARALVRERLQLSAADCDSLIDLVRSRLDQSFARALAARAQGDSQG